MFPAIQPDDVPNHLKIRCHKIEPSTDVEGFIVGPLVMVVAHWSGKASKPCPFAMTAGKLDCPCLREPLPKRKLGYLPLQTFRGERVAVILSNLVAVRAVKLPQGAAVKITRSKVPCAPLILQELGEYAYSSTAQQQVRKREPLNIQPWLLHLWNHEALRRYYLEPESASGQPPETSTPVHSPIPDAEALPVDPSAKIESPVKPKRGKQPMA